MSEESSFYENHSYIYSNQVLVITNELRMTNASGLNQRLISAILRAPSCRNSLPTPFPCYHSAPKDWIRTITSSSARHASNANGVSFGKENDGLIASYIGGSAQGKGRKFIKKEDVQSVKDSDDYEISGFIDRSKKISHKFAAPLEDVLNASDDNATSSQPEKKSRTGKRQQNDDIRRNKRNGTPLPNTRLESSVARERRTRDKTEGRVVENSISNENSLERPEPKGLEPWMIQKNALKEKFKEGWSPRKKLSPDAMEGIKGLHDSDPMKYTTEFLAEQFKVSPEAIRRILKSKWLARQSPEKMQERRERWAKRHDRIWDQQAELGLRPKRTKAKQVEDPDQFEQDLERRRILGEI